MSEATVAAEAAPVRSGFGQDLIDLYVSPREAFERITVHPRVWVPLLVFIAMQLLFTAVWLQNLDMTEFLRAQAEASGSPMPEGQEVPVGFFQAMFWVSAVVFSPGFLALMAAIFLGAFNALLQAQVSFRQSFSIQLHTFVAVFLVTLPATIVIMMLKGDWNIDPQQALLASPTLLLDAQTTPKWLYSLLGSLDLFSFWIIWLLATGYRAATRRPALAMVVTLWVVWVVGKAGLTAITG